MTDWQPYATAPRDGSWLRLKGRFTRPEGERVRWAPSGFWINAEGHIAAFEFTHWRPDT